MAYASLDDLTQYLGIDDSTADDGKLTQFLARAQAAIDNETRRVFEVVADSMRWHGAGSVQGRTLFLDGDCCAITSITNGNGATVAASEYYTLPRNRTPYYALELYSDSTVAWVDGGRPTAAAPAVALTRTATVARTILVRVFMPPKMRPTSAHEN